MHKVVLVMSSHRVLLRGGTVLTMDPRIGTHTNADVLVEDGLI